MNGEWGTRACAEQNEAVKAVETLRAALVEAEDAASVKIVRGFRMGMITDDEFVRSIKENHAATDEFRKQLNKIQSRVNA